MYRVSVYRPRTKPDPRRPGQVLPDFSTPADFRKRRMPIAGRVELILAPANPPPLGPLVLIKKPAETKWRRGEVIVV